MPIIKIIIFYECEHNGDLNEYIRDLVCSGAEIIDSRINYSEEIGYAKIRVENWGKFIEKFKNTVAYEMSNLCF